MVKIMVPEAGLPGLKPWLSHYYPGGPWESDFTSLGIGFLICKMGFVVVICLTKNSMRTFLVVQWLRIHLPMQRTLVWSLVQDNPTCRGAAKPMYHNYWSPWALEPGLYNKRHHCSEKPAHQSRVAPTHCNQRKPLDSSKDPVQPKINTLIDE